MNSQDIARAYDAIVDQYVLARSPSYGLDYLDRFRDLLPAGGSVLDAGCGPGIPMARRLVETGLSVHGIDISPRMIEIARANVPDATFEVADMADWESDATFDGILAWDACFHLSPRYHAPLLRRLYHMLSPGGVLMITVGGIEGELRSPMLGRELYYGSLSRAAYGDILGDAGYEVAAMEDDQPGEHHVVVIARRMP